MESVQHDAMYMVLMFSTILAPIVTAVIEMIKRMIPLPKNYLPLISVAVGLALSAAAFPLTDLDLSQRLWAGGLAGLASTGLYETLFNKREGRTK